MSHPPDVHLPNPSVWQFVLGAAIALVAFGALTSWLFCIVGAVLFVMALVGWIQELRDE